VSAVGYASLLEDLALARLAAVQLDAEAEVLWKARQYRLALRVRGEAAVEREYVRTLESLNR
jgi:hypothetical protein